jgi:hypothetical protein
MHTLDDQYIYTLNDQYIYKLQILIFGPKGNSLSSSLR